MADTHLNIFCIINARLFKGKRDKWKTFLHSKIKHFKPTITKFEMCKTKTSEVILV